MRPTIPMCIIALLVVILIADFAIDASADSIEQVSLIEAVAIAKQHNPDLGAMAQDLAIADGELKKAHYLTQSNFEGETEGWYRARSNRSNSQDWRVAMQQEFEIFGQRSLRIHSASLGRDEAVANFLDATRLLVAAVKMTFFDAIRSARRFDLAREMADLDQRLLDAARSQLEAGDIASIDFGLAQVQSGRSKRALLAAQEEFRVQRSALGRILGGYLGAEPAPREAATPIPTLPDLNILEENARRTRPDLRARQLEIARLETEAALNQRMRLPNPIIGAFVGHESDTEHIIGPSLGFSMPLFNPRSAEAAIIEAQRSRAAQRLRATSLDIEREVRDAFNQYLTATQALAVYQQDVIAPAREIMQLHERAFREGKIDLFRLSFAERESFEAQAGYIDAQFDVNAAAVALELAGGVSP
ncbi:MAG TPA: TolC family protein [Candidatus Binataceae bacterium]|nr:TolC family protein [Candidatus Binataceae bacterium]